MHIHILRGNRMHQPVNYVSRQSSGFLSSHAVHKITGCIMIGFMIIFMSPALPFPMLSGQFNTQEPHLLIHQSQPIDNHMAYGGDVSSISINLLPSVIRSSAFYEQPTVHPFFAFTVKAIFWGIVIAFIRKIIRRHTGYYDFKLIES